MGVLYVSALCKFLIGQPPTVNILCGAPHMDRQNVLRTHVFKKDVVKQRKNNNNNSKIKTTCATNDNNDDDANVICFEICYNYYNMIIYFISFIQCFTKI